MIRVRGNNFEIKAKAVAFDKDGTLTEGLKVWRKIFEKQMEVSRSLGLNIEEKAREIFGVDLDSQSTPLAIAYSDEEVTLLAVSIWLSHHFDWDECRKMASEVVEKALNEISDDELFIPVKGAKEALTKIATYVPVAIATSDSKENVERLLKNWRLENKVDFIITSKDVKRGKPYPYMLEKICSTFGVKCSELLMIGDNKVDVEMAKSAGTKIITVGSALDGADGWVKDFTCLEIETEN